MKLVLQLYHCQYLVSICTAQTPNMVTLWASISSVLVVQLIKLGMIRKRRISATNNAPWAQSDFNFMTIILGG